MDSSPQNQTKYFRSMNNILNKEIRFQFLFLSSLASFVADLVFLGSTSQKPHTIMFLCDLY